MLHRIETAAPLAIFILLLFGCQAPSDEQQKAGSRTEEIAETLNLPDSVFFWRDVSPILYQNCTPCHHKNGAGPFELISYNDVKKRTKTIRLAVADGYMPPWPADPSYRHFKGEKVLTPAEKGTLLKWISQGAPEGELPREIPEPKTVINEELGEPDLILSFPDTVQIPGKNLDQFKLAKIAFDLPYDTLLRAIQFKPGNRQLIHHVNGHMLNYNFDKKQNPKEGEWVLNAEKINSIEAYRKMKLANDLGAYPPLRVSAFNYLPGVEPVNYPDGIGTVHIKRKGAFMLNTLHYGPSAIDTFDLSEIHLYFAEKPPERNLRELQMGTLGITPITPDFVIYADSICEFETRYRVKEDISVLTVNPHMHLLGKSFKAYASSGNGSDTIPLVHIPKWDFRWQYFYTFEKMVRIPKGYEIVVEAEFDNTMDNPFNPFSPPKTIRTAGENMKTTDEMFQFFVDYVPYRDGDENIEL
ncbi:MAG: hypothetical protein ABR574_02785 [Cryomorphaceae bacterium]|nr:hypothetical protein [Flavobacteriales bacterium]